MRCGRPAPASRRRRGAGDPWPDTQLQEPRAGEAPLRRKPVPASCRRAIGRVFGVRPRSRRRIVPSHRRRDLGLCPRSRAAIVSRDSDFHQASFLRGSPPKVIWIRRGNCTTADIEEVLRANLTQILAFGADQVAAFLALSQAVSSRQMTDLSCIRRELEKSRRKVLDGLVPSGTILR